jgi:hypothetical protein
MPIRPNSNRSPRAHPRAAAFRQLLTDTEPRHVEAVLELTDRAYRRPLSDNEKKSQLRGLYRRLRAQELAHEDAIRLMLARVFVSPAFLYSTETAPPGNVSARVNDYEMASRLSYFLCSSMPDAELRKAADTGKLRTPEAVQAQARRMRSLRAGNSACEAFFKERKIPVELITVEEGVHGVIYWEKDPRFHTWKNR